MPLEKPEKPLRSIPSVEIFSAGVWNGDEYTEADLDEMVKAFNETRDGVPPPLKLGHDDNQQLLQNDGYPAAGWVGNVYRQGKKLLADFIDIPDKIYELIRRGAYKKVSSEVYWNAEINGQKYNRMLAGVALLGADMPAVGNLSDILSMYGMKINSKKFYAESKSVPTIKIYKFSKGGKRMLNEQELSDLEKQKAKSLELEAQLNTLRKSQEEQTRETELLRKHKQEYERRIVELERAGKESQLESQLTEMVHTGEISPSMRPYAKELLGDEKKVYTIKAKEYSKKDLLKELLGLHAEMVKLNKKESTIDGDRGIPEVNPTEEEIRKYERDNKVSFKEAYKAVLRGKLSNRFE